MLPLGGESIEGGLGGFIGCLWSWLFVGVVGGAVGRSTC